jgi:alkylation response protein AidB-like acyl-CoA dehydrogenase
MIRHAAKMMDDKDPEAGPFCAMAKRVATNNGFEVCNDALQVRNCACLSVCVFSFCSVHGLFVWHAVVLCSNVEGTLFASSYAV